MKLSKIAKVILGLGMSATLAAPALADGVTQQAVIAKQDDWNGLPNAEWSGDPVHNDGNQVKLQSGANIVKHTGPAALVLSTTNADDKMTKVVFEVYFNSQSHKYVNPTLRFFYRRGGGVESKDVKWNEMGHGAGPKDRELCTVDFKKTIGNNFVNTAPFKVAIGAQEIDLKPFNGYLDINVSGVRVDVEQKGGKVTTVEPSTKLNIYNTTKDSYDQDAGHIMDHLEGTM